MSKNTIEAEGLSLILSIQNKSAAEFKKDQEDITSGKVCWYNNINSNTYTSEVFSGWATSGTWAGFVGSASWSYAIPETKELAVLTLKFDIPYDGNNTGSLSGNKVFQEHFEINPNINMPSGGMQANLSATISTK